MSHTLLIYAFLLYWSIFGEIHWELSFLDIKVTRRNEHCKIRKFDFLTMFEGANPVKNLDLFKQFFMIKPVKDDKCYKTFFLQKVSHIVLNYAFLLFWSVLGEFIEKFSFNIKVTSAETSTEILSQFVFLTMFDRGKILRKIWFV